MKFFKIIFTTFPNRKKYHAVHCMDASKGVVRNQQYYATQDRNTLACCNKLKLDCRVDVTPAEKSGFAVAENVCVEENKGQKMGDAMRKVADCCRTFGKDITTETDDVEEIYANEKCQ